MHRFVSGFLYKKPTMPGKGKKGKEELIMKVVIQSKGSS